MRLVYVGTFGELSSVMRHQQIESGKCLDLHVCGKASDQKDVEGHSVGAYRPVICEA